MPGVCADILNTDFFSSHLSSCLGLTFASKKDTESAAVIFSDISKVLFHDRV